MVSGKTEMVPSNTLSEQTELGPHHRTTIVVTHRGYDATWLWCRCNGARLSPSHTITWCWHVIWFNQNCVRGQISYALLRNRCDIATSLHLATQPDSWSSSFSVARWQLASSRSQQRRVMVPCRCSSWRR